MAGYINHTDDGHELVYIEDGVTRVSPAEIKNGDVYPDFTKEKTDYGPHEIEAYVVCRTCNQVLNSADSELSADWEVH